MANFLLLVWDLTSWGSADEAERERNDRGHGEFIENNRSAISSTAALGQPADSVTVTADGAGGFLITDGPFAETKEGLGGFYLVEAANRDAAVALAQQLPFVGGTSSVEVRPVAIAGLP